MIGTDRADMETDKKKIIKGSLRTVFFIAFDLPLEKNYKCPNRRAQVFLLLAKYTCMFIKGTVSDRAQNRKQTTDRSQDTVTSCALTML